jgi:hypothetical protein
MRSTAGSPRTVAAAVAVDTQQIEAIRRELKAVPKWGRCSEDSAGFVVDLMRSQAIAVAVIGVNRDTPAWRRFLADADTFHNAVILTSKKVAGWGKPTNILKFLLLGSACAMATGHTLGVDGRPRIVGSDGRQLIDCSTVCDAEVEGPENLEVFESFWGMQHIPRSRLAKVGINIISNDVRVTTEQLEPCLLLADYAAGLGLASTTDEPGSLPMPLAKSVATRLLSRLRERGKLVVREEEFDYTYDEIFGEVMEKARELADG